MKKILLILILLVGCGSPSEPDRMIWVQVIVSATQSATTGFSVGDQYIAFTTTHGADTLSAWGAKGEAVSVYVAGPGEKVLTLRIDGRLQATNETLGRLWWKGIL